MLHLNPKLLAWLWLLLAIITEVLGSSFLKLAQNMSYGFLVTAFFICVSYYFIGLSIKRISVSVAYAMWEVLGVICIVLIGIWYFDENLALVQYAGIACAIVGILLINFGEIDSGDSALGEQCGSVASFAEGTNTKFANLPQKTQSSHSPTANLRILEEDKQAGCEKPAKNQKVDSSSPSYKSFIALSAGLIAVVVAAFVGYMLNASLLGFFLVCAAAVLDVVANLLLKASNGFSKLGYGLGAVGVVIGAFYLLMLALDSMELAVAYSSWGAIGIIGTIAGGRILFGERLNAIGYVGVVLVIAAVGLLHEII